MDGDEGRRARRMRLLAVLTLLVVFAAGALVGAAVQNARGGHDGPRGAPGRRGGPPPIFAEGSPVAERLNLTAAQRDSIEKIVANDRIKADSLYRQMRPRLRARFDSTTAAIDAVLTPQQRAEWHKIRQELDQRRGGRGGRGRRGPEGMPPPPPPGS